MTTPQERLAELHAKGQELAQKGIRSAEESTALEGFLTEARELRAQIEQNQAFGELNDWATRSTGTIPVAGPGGVAVENFTRDGAVGVNQHESGAASLEDEADTRGLDARTAQMIKSASYGKAFRSYLRTGVGRGYDDSAIRTLQEGADSSGGFLVPADFLAKVVSKDPTPTRVAARVTRLQTGRDTLIMPKVVYNTDNLYTTGIRVNWTGEIPASATTARVTDPVFGRIQIPIYTAMLSIPLTNDMIEDSAFPLLDYIAGKFGETIELLYDNMALNGTGVGQPSGILVNPADTTSGNQPSVVVSGSASALTADGLVAAAMSLPEQYDVNAAWVFNKTNTGQAIAKLKDSNNRYLWGAGLQDSGLEAGFMDRRLIGYPVVFSGFMPNVGSSTYPAIFGDLSGYYLVNRVGFSVQVLRELYAETNQILVLGRIRFGGQTAEPWKMLIHQCHT